MLQTNPEDLALSALARPVATRAGTRELRGQA